MSDSFAPVEIHFKDGHRFIMERSTIQMFPESLLVERLASLKGSSNIINFNREVGMFKLIKQLMIYKSRCADVRAADRAQLKKELRYFKLENLLMYVESPRVGDFKYCIPSRIDDSNIDVAALILMPTLVIYASFHKLSRIISLGEFNFQKYQVLHCERYGDAEAVMEYYVGHRENFSLRLECYHHDSRLLYRSIHWFLLAIDRFDNERRVIVGGKIIRKMLGDELEVSDGKKRGINSSEGTNGTGMEPKRPFYW